MISPLGEWTAAERTRARVLVMEDSLSMSAAIRVMLSYHGHESVFVLDSTQGIKALESSRFDLALIDVFIPEKDGLKTIKDVRLMMPSLPIVAMSGVRVRNVSNSVVDVLGMAVQVGATSSLPMPFTQKQLGAAIYAGLNPAVTGGIAAVNGWQC